MLPTTSRPKNLLLRALPEDEYQRLAPHLTTVSLPLGTVLYKPLDRIETAYFPEQAVVSLVHTLENGATSETGLVGLQGMVGLPALLGSGYANKRVVVQVADSLNQIPVPILKQEFEQGGELRKLVLLYAEVRLSQISQQVVCNAHHNIQERFARWLLSVQDLVNSHELPLTQEFIAEMLGVRRSSVTVTAGTLQQAGIIQYKRGKIKILDQKALEEVSCECYDDLKANYSRLLGFE